MFNLYIKKKILGVITFFDKYFLLLNKQYDYMWFKNGLLSKIKYSEFSQKYITLTKSLNYIEFILKIPYFSTLFIKFIEAE